MLLGGRLLWVVHGGYIVQAAVSLAPFWAVVFIRALEVASGHTGLCTRYGKANFVFLGVQIPRVFS